MMGDLEESAGAEAHRQRAVRLVAQGLGRVEEKGAGVRRGGWREAKRHLQRLLLEHAERALGVASQVEVRRRRARLIEDFEPMDRIEAETAPALGRPGTLIPGRGVVAKRDEALSRPASQRR